MEIAVGGQAVIEGVMMRGPAFIATAIRRKNGDIEIKRQPLVSRTKTNRFLGLPVIRGFVSLIEMMIIGFSSLSFSADRMELDHQDENKKAKSRSGKKLEEFLSFAFAIILGLGLFFYLPYKLVDLSGLGEKSLSFNIFAGLLRIVFFLVYVWLISLMKDIRRVFEFHGAEHKTVHAYENDRPLSVEEINRFSTLHPRCGTSFIFFVLLVAILVFSIVDTLMTGWLGFRPSPLLRFAYHLPLIPLISGISYELLRFSGKRRNHPIVRLFTYPGMALQKITTKPPDSSQIEVAVCALKAALEISIEPAETDVRWIEDSNDTRGKTEPVA